MTHPLLRKTSKRRVCVIGAGTAGLCAIRHALAADLEVTAYEIGAEIGGTWVYSDNTTSSQYEEEIISSLYEGLRTNLPKEVMGYPDFLYPDSIKESFIKSSEVLEFLQSYANHFKLQPHIKFQHEVIRTRPRNGEWEIYVWDKVNNSYDEAFFDFIFVCNGHYTSPRYPELEGMKEYRGRQLHSHLYRKASMFKDAKVLIVGAGASGMDITNLIHKTAAQVFLSHHLTPPPCTNFMPNVIQKPDVKNFTETGAVFNDDSTETFSFVIYCTGYNYSFPCISTDSGFRVVDNWVEPLWKHCININEPSMALIGLPFNVCPTQLCDMQVRFALKFFKNQKELPERNVMMKEMECEMEKRWAKGYSKRQAHEMGKEQFEYFRDLAEIADIVPVKPVIEKILREFSDCNRKYIYELDTYRDTRYRVVDDDSFVKLTGPFESA